MQSVNKVKLFLENFIVYGLGGIISKVIPLIMVPIITRIMPSSDYLGISDLSNTIISFASAIAVMGMYDAMYRMFFEKEDGQFQIIVCSTTLLFNIMVSILVFIVLILFRNYIALAFFDDESYSYVVYISAIATLVGSTNSIVSAPTRMQNKKFTFLIINTISPIISYAVSIPLLLAGHYVVALPIAGAISGMTTEIIFGVLNRKWFHIHQFDIGLLKEMLVVALPMLPSFLVYWIFNSSDRVMISNILDLNSVGIYSVAAKIGMCSQLIYTAFAGGWQYYAFATMRDANQVENNSRIFEYLGIISFSATVLLSTVSHLLFKLLFPSEYTSGYVIAPYLFLAPLLQMLYQVIANQFLIIKKTWPSMLILSIGALANVGLNFFLIPLIGIEGAAIGTVLGYVISDILCTMILLRMELMVISRRFVISTLFTVIYLIIWRLCCSNNTLLSLVFALILILTVACLYRNELQKLMKLVRNN